MQNLYRCQCKGTISTNFLVYQGFRFGWVLCNKLGFIWRTWDLVVGMFKSLYKYRTGTWESFVIEGAEYSLVVVRIWEIRLPDENRHKKRNHVFYYWKGNKDHIFRAGFLGKSCIDTAVKKVEFVNNRMLYLILQGWWCHFFVVECMSQL